LYNQMGGGRVEIGEEKVFWGQFVGVEKLRVRIGGGAGDLGATQPRAVPAPSAPVDDTGRLAPAPSAPVVGTGRLAAGLCNGKKRSR